MNRLIRIAKTGTPGAGVQFRAEAYGRLGIRDFLRDVLALANAAVDGPRYIVTGIAVDAGGKRRTYPIDPGDFSGRPAYDALVSEYIEPPIRIRYEPVTLNGKPAGVFEIGDCQDRPYMMRVDHCETLRRGDAYVRSENAAVKMGRRQLQALFEKKFRDAVLAPKIEVGFPGDIIYKERRVATCDLLALPSAVAAAKLEEFVESRAQLRSAGTNTAMARLTHARLFGSDVPYEDRSTEKIHAEMLDLKRRYADHDQQFLFNENRADVQIVVLNQGEETLRDAALTIVMPRHAALHVAMRLPKVQRHDAFVEPSSGEQADYPAVTVRNEALQVSANIGDIGPGITVDAFARPLRICVGNELAGRRLGIRYRLHSQNLRSPAEGLLRLLF
jgi:hypothetical protein